jgi:hypothetical protein
MDCFYSDVLTVGLVELMPALFVFKHNAVMGNKQGLLHAV